MYPLPAAVRPVCRLLPLVLLALALAPLAPAAARGAAPAEPWDSPAFSAAPAHLLRAAAALEGERDGGVDVLLLETVYTFDAAGREARTERLVYRFTAAGVHESWSAVEEAWSPWHQERPRLRARVITPDGTEHPLDPATVAENAGAAGSPDMFEDGRVLRAPLPATGPGAIVEQEVTVRETAPFFDAGTTSYARVQMGVPVRLARVVLEAPADLPLRWVARQLPGSAPREELSGGRRRLTFEHRNVPAFEEPEPGLPPEVPRTAYIAFSTGRSWSDLARRYSEIVDQAIRGSDLSAVLRSAGGPAGSQLETVDRLLAKLGREIRYTGVELGEGGVIPRSPAETLKRRFGDCKDKAVLLTALLRAMDIPAYVALLNAGEDTADVEESLPGLGAFNHAIVMVPGSPAVWIDPTDPFARAGELPVADQGRLALVASPNAAGLVRTPEATSARNREVETREIYLADLDGARIVETTEYSGSQEQELRAAYAAVDRQEVRAALEEYAAEAYLAERLTGLDFVDPHDLSRPFRLRLEAEGAARGTTDVGEAAVAVFLSTLTDRLPEELLPGGFEEEETSRQHDYVFARPLQVEIRYRIVPPPGFAPRPLPASYRVRDLGPAKLEESYSALPDGSVEAILRFDSGKRRISAAELAALRRGLAEISEEKPVLLELAQVGESHLAAGRVREALGEFRRLAALDPKKALPRVRIARALLAGGLGEAARREAEEATRIEPGLAYAWNALGWIRQHDELGRRFGRRHDRAGAIAAYRRSLEIDPNSTSARGDLAILLEHDAEGTRYAPGSDLAAAVEEYRKLPQEVLDELGLSNNLVIALMWAGRFDEIKELLGTLESSDQRLMLRLVAVAALDGPEAALREAERTAGGEARAGALSGAARQLMLLRRYEAAAALFEAAGRQSRNASALLATADLLRRTRPHEELSFTADEPEGAARRLLQLASGGRPAHEQLSRLMSRELLADLGEEGLASLWEGFEEGFQKGLRKAREAEIPSAVAVDLGIAALRATVTGEPGPGFRVALDAAAGEGVHLKVYVVPEDGGYRIAALGAAPVGLGAEALRRLNGGDLPGARRWLDWAFEELSGAAPPDPMLASPFLSLWSKGAAAEAPEVRCAAASLITWENRIEALLPVLRQCREAAPEGPRQGALDRALLAAYNLTDRYDEAAAAARALQQSAPDSPYLFLVQVGAHGERKRWGEVKRLAEERLTRSPGDSLAAGILSEVQIREGELDAAAAVLQGALDAGARDSEPYNRLAWIRLLQGAVDERTGELARRAAELSGYRSHAVLHTLATVYAEQGRPAEAYRVLLEAMAAGEGEPTIADWYVFGRLAEHYGLPEVARGYYQRANPQEGELHPMSTVYLVRKRLEALGPRPPEPKRAASRR